MNQTQQTEVTKKILSAVFGDLVDHIMAVDEDEARTIVQGIVSEAISQAKEEEREKIFGDLKRMLQHAETLDQLKAGISIYIYK